MTDATPTISDSPATQDETQAEERNVYAATIRYAPGGPDEIVGFYEDLEEADQAIMDLAGGELALDNVNPHSLNVLKVTLGKPLGVRARWFLFWNLRRANTEENRNLNQQVIRAKAAKTDVADDSKGEV